LPFDVPANEFMTIEGKKISTSRNWAVWMPDYLNNYAPDPLRYLLSANMPETNDTDFSWREYVRRNNDELVATYGNLVHRVLTLAYRNFDGKVPSPASPDETDRLLTASCEEVFKEVDDCLSNCQFRQALSRAMALGHEANRYLDGKAPWKVIKSDPQAAANTLYTAIGAISALKTMLYPFLPFSSQKLHEYLGFEGNIENSKWEISIPKPGQPMIEPQALFTKLDEEIVEKETQKLGH
jgi:methionyl-tRNA synthetase